MTSRKHNQNDEGYGIASFILALVGIFLVFLVPVLSIIFPILALVFYNKQKKIKSTTLSRIGLGLGIAGLVLNIIMIVLVAGLVALIISSVNVTV